MLLPEDGQNLLIFKNEKDIDFPGYLRFLEIDNKDKKLIKTKKK
jgi:hypothetical protein